ncbi:MAG: hypothetical protein K0Q72_3140 [Armatimonadetes bacterium]|jgi:hypothetical protein|nr:hypothetical protein [Armatimonadota bacterium]
MISGVGTLRHRRGRAAVVIVAVLAAAIIAGVAWFSESLSMALKLQMWDKGAPARSVRGYLEAAKKGDKAAADRFLDTKALQPLTKNGKWVGYRQPLPITGFANYRNSEIVPKEFPAQPPVEFVTMGEGAAVVKMPAADGREASYRLERRSSGWIVTELGGGKISAK